MMRAKLLSLHARRAMLVSRIADNRERVGAILDRADAASLWLTAGAAAAARAGEGIKRNPLLFGAGVALLVAARPRRVMSWLLRGWSLYQVYKRGSALWQDIAPAAAMARR